MKRTILLFSMIMLLLAGCGAKEQSVEEVKDIPKTSISFTSGAEEVTQEVPVNPKRVVVIGDNMAEILIHFGVEDSIVGLAYTNNSFSPYQEQIKSLPLITESWPSKEAIMLLEPDMIITIDSALKPDLIGSIEDWNNKGIPVLSGANFTTGISFDSYFLDIQNVGKTFGIQEKTDEFVQNMQTEITKYKENTEHLGNTPTVLVLGATPNSFYYYSPEWCLLSQIVEDTGGEYLRLSDQLSMELSTEAILQANPEYIIITEYQQPDMQKVIEKLTTNPNFQKLDAVKNSRILAVNYTTAINGGFDLLDMYEDVFMFLQEKTVGVDENEK